MNSSCLEGMACPKCASQGPFDIEVKGLSKVDDFGAEGIRDVEWEDSSFCFCFECEHEGTVKEFSPEVIPDNESPVCYYCGRARCKVRDSDDIRTLYKCGCGKVYFGEEA